MLSPDESVPIKLYSIITLSFTLTTNYRLSDGNFLDIRVDQNTALFDEDGKYEDFNSVESLWKAIHSEKFRYPEKLKLIELRWFINCYRKGWY